MVGAICCRHEILLGWSMRSSPPIWEYGGYSQQTLSIAAGSSRATTAHDASMAAPYGDVSNGDPKPEMMISAVKPCSPR